jgi:hypothetical protein
MGPLLSSSEATNAAARLLLPVGGRLRGRQHHVIRSVQSGANLGNVVHLVEVSGLPFQRLSPILRPSSGTFGSERRWRCPELSDFV